MAGDWMKVEKVTPDKPEIDAIASKLALDPDAVFGKCFRIWRWFDDHTVNGNAPRVTKSALDRRVGVEGFADAMASERWLSISDDGICLPNFERHCGETAKQRALTAKRVAKKKMDANAKGNAKVTDEALPREEKRREESSPSSPPPPATQGGDSPSSQAWKGVEEDLRNAGVRLWREAASSARSNGCTTDAVVNVIGFWRLNAGAWDAGALFQRVSNMLPGEDCSDLWPEKSPKFEASKRREESSKSQQAATSNRRADVVRKSADQQLLANLEAEFGQKIDGLSDEDVRSAIRSAEPGGTGDYMLSRYRGGRPTGTTREAILTHFSQTREAATFISEAP